MGGLVLKKVGRSLSSVLQDSYIKISFIFSNPYTCNIVTLILVS